MPNTSPTGANRRSARANDERAKALKAMGALSRSFVPRFWEEADQRLVIVKAIRERYETLKADCGADSFQKDILCQRAVFIALWLETQERQAIETGVFDAGGFIQACNGLLGILKTLGLHKARKAIPSLKAYINRSRQAGAEVEAVE